MGLSDLLVGALRLLLGVTARWETSPVLNQQRIYFANHTSHMDTLAVLSALPKSTWRHTRPVAAADYWGKNRVLAFIARRGMRALLIERRSNTGKTALAPVEASLRRGDSIILFPEGTRGDQPLPGPFKSGLYHLHQQFPHVALVPVYLYNFNRALPKGKYLPLPILCSLRVGDPLEPIAGESKVAFLHRANAAIVRLAR